MAKIRLVDNKYVPKNYESGQSFTPAQWSLAGKFRPEHALRISAEIRATGQEATAIHDTGGESIEPRVEAPRQQVSEEINWVDANGNPIPWRIQPTRIATPDGTPKYVYLFKDEDSDTMHSIVGRSPQDVIDRLQISHPIYTKHLAGLSAAPAPAPTVPVAVAASAAPVTPPKVLRRGSQMWDPNAIPEQRISQRDSFTASAAAAQSYSDFYKLCSAAQFKERCKNDPKFLAWANTETK